MLFLLLLGVLPPLLLILYMYKLDRIEREPIGLLLHLFIAGGLTTIGAGYVERLGMWLVDLTPLSGLAQLAVTNFIVVALVEEGVKMIALRRISWYDRNFDHVFDAVVYSVAVSLGFAAFENVMYLLSFGVRIAPIRAITAIPMHCITGIFMGHYYGQAKYCENMHWWNHMTFYNVIAVVIPVLLHGFYDFAASSNDMLLSCIFFAYVVILDIVAFASVRKYAKRDRLL